MSIRSSLLARDTICATRSNKKKSKKVWMNQEAIRSGVKHDRRTWRIWIFQTIDPAFAAEKDISCTVLFQHRVVYTVFAILALILTLGNEREARGINEKNCSVFEF